MVRMKYSDEMRAFIAENTKGLTIKESTDLFNLEFGTTIKASQMAGYRKNNGIKSGLSGRFEKGSIPQNKGKKMSREQYEKRQATMFQKGRIPHNHKEIGYERVDDEGYILIKVAEPNIFKHKHRLVWEKHHGPIPKDSLIIFLDGNKENVEIENLHMITKSLNSVMNNKGLRSDDKELTEVGIAIGKLMQATKKAKKGA